MLLNYKYIGYKSFIEYNRLKNMGLFSSEHTFQQYNYTLHFVLNYL